MNTRVLLEAILSDSVYSYEFDVTTGIVEQEITGRDGTNYNRLLGLSVPYAFDDSVGKLVPGQQNRASIRQQHGETAITRNRLLAEFAEGNRCVETIVSSNRGNRLYKISYYLWQEESTGHIHACSVCRDLTGKQHLQQVNQELRAQMKIIGGLSNAYFVVLWGNLNEKVIVPVKVTDFVQRVLDASSGIEDVAEKYVPLGVRPEDQEKMRAFTDWRTLKNRLAGRDVIDIEFRGTQTDWCRASWIVSERGEGGEPVGVLYAVEDITADMERRLALIREREALLDMTGKQLSTMTEAIHGGFKISKNDPKFSFILVSEQLAQLFGYDSPEELMQASDGAMAGLVNHEDTYRELPQAWQSIREGKMYTMHYRARCKDGTWKNIEDRGRLIRNATGTEEFWSFIVDQEELVQKSEALEAARTANRILEDTKQQLQKNLEIVGSLSENYLGIYYIDLSTCEYYEIKPTMLPQAQRIVGTEGNAESSFRRVLQELVVPACREEMAEFTDLTTLADRLLNRNSLSCQFAGPNLGWMEGYFIAAGRDAAGRCTHAIWALRCIQEQKEKDELHREELKRAKEEAEAANRAKTTFLLNMSHDIRTPMNAILGYQQLLRKATTDPDILYYEKKMETAGRFLLSLINNVLDMARIESGHMELHPEYADTRVLFAEILEIHEEQAKKKNLRFELSRNAEHVHVLCDRLKLQQVVTNLIGNAIKYTPNGGTVLITTEELPNPSEGKVIFKICVTDTGIGMSEGFLPHVFDDFSRERDTTSGGVPGTGLGMALVKSYLELMGGTIDVDSELGKGTRFTVILPLQLADPSRYERERAVPKPETEEMLCPLAGKRILLAEDNEMNAEIASIILENLGCSVDHAADGFVCVDMVEHSPSGTYDFVLMDIQMPAMDGYQATRAIRNLRDADKANIPIVAMSANTFEEDMQNAFRAGMNGYIAKPFDVAELVGTLTGLVGQKPL